MLPDGRKNVLFNKPRIVSVSRRTDIPAFYGERFRQQVRQGWAVSCNPFSRRAVRVSLRPGNERLSGQLIRGYLNWGSMVDNGFERPNGIKIRMELKYYVNRTVYREKIT
ncbi:protein of unknown function [Desulfofundulus australicus DSM 11792]|uniref:Uncharacterized protein n=1 Tax=Desulfofundulus australicus DSM 11792 TaxID=1121425 RepID=A0A1M4VEW0_9FIRM|nr:protein of unknown function [Desulfofundulus australicus DSM 11792]